MQSAHAYLAVDRRLALAAGRLLPRTAQGAVLFADISGFTHLTNLLVELAGPRRGAEEVTRHLNRVYGALIQQVTGLGGSVVSFSGDGMLCWFPAEEQELAEATLRAVCAAARLHEQMAAFHEIELQPGRNTALGLKVAIAAGMAHRFVAGDPEIQLFDVLGGLPVDLVAAAEPLAQRGEIVAAADTVALLDGWVEVDAWRSGEPGPVAAIAPQAGLCSRFSGYVSPFTQARVEIPVAQVRPWLLPVVEARLAAGQERYLAELRPAVALFLRFQGLDLANDELAPACFDRYVRRVQEVLARCDATLIQVTTGDKGSYLYAAFGATVVHDDDALRAVLAGLELAQTPATLAPIGHAQIGIARGRLRVGAYGSDLRSTFGAQGSAVNLAARLMMEAQPGEVLVDASVAAAVAGQVRLEELGPTVLKGMEQPVALYRAQGLHRLDASPQRAAHPVLIGREPELAQLGQCAATVTAGRGQMVELSGPAGIGKSALLAAWAAQLASAGWRVAQCQTQSARRHVAYDGLGQLLRSLLPLPAAELGREAAAVLRLQSWTEQVAPEWLSRLPLLREVLRLPLADTPLTTGLDARSRQQAITALVLAILRELARPEPVLLAVDDVQWLDEASLAILQGVAQASAGLRVLLLLARRDGEPYDAGWPADCSLVLGTLPEPAVGALAAQRLGGPVDATAQALVAALAQGNPLLVAEVVGALRASGQVMPGKEAWTLAPPVLDALRAARALVATEQGWTLTPALADAAGLLGLPDSVHGLILARIDRLPEAAKLTVKVASVVGRVFEFDVLARAHPALPEPETLRRQLVILERLELARPLADERHDLYVFHHNLTQEVVYQTLLASQQRDLHGAVGEALEQVQPEAVERLAHHYAAAGPVQPSRRAKALTYLEAAAAKARQEYANATALHFLDQALALETHWEWVQAKIEILHLLGRRSEEAAALETLAGLGPEPATVTLERLTSQYHEAVGDFSAAADAAGRALAAAQAHSDPAQIAGCLVQLARVAGRAGDYSAEADYYRRALAVVEPVPGLAAEAIDIRYGLGVVLQQQGDYAAAEAELQQAWALAQGCGRLVDEARALMALGVVARLTRHFDQAQAHTARSLGIRRLVGDRVGEGDSLLLLAQVVLHGQGALGRGRDLLQEALAIQQELRNRWSEAVIWNELGIVYLLAGAWDEAVRCLRSSLDLCGEIGATAGQAHILCNLGQVLRDRGEPEAAQAAFAQGFAIAQQLGDPHTQAQYWSEMALLALQQGDPETARDLAAEAEAAQRDLGLEVMTTADLCTQAEACHHLGDRETALHHVHRALALLDACAGSGPDYPHRDYYRCGRLLAQYSAEEAAAKALAAAYDLLMGRAAAIDDPVLRRSYLEIPIHAAIAAQDAAIPSSRQPVDTGDPRR